MHLRRTVLATAVLLSLVFPVAAVSAPNTCLSGKIKCASSKTQSLLKCHVTAEKNGEAVDSACTTKARAKFDGTLLVPPNPAKGCFEKREGRQHPSAPQTLCLTEDDTSALEDVVDDFVDDVLNALDPGYPAPVLNACSAGKKKCVLKKAGGLLKCHEKAAKQGMPLDAACMQTARDKFDGGSDPSAACFARLEAKPPCLTNGDQTAVGSRVENFVNEVTCQLQPGSCPTPCCPGPTPTPSPTPTVTPTGPTPTPTAGPCPATLELTRSAGGERDEGWTGADYEEPLVSGGVLTAAITGCANATTPCGDCTLAGPVPNAVGTTNTRRCTNNWSRICAFDADCGTLCLGGANDGGTCAAMSACGSGTCVAAGSCEFFTSAPIPLAVTGYGLCDTETIDRLTGTANADAGTLSVDLEVTRETFVTTLNIAEPCPRCLGDAVPNDGVRGGTCSVGPRSGLACDGHGAHPNSRYGPTSLDCPLSAPTSGKRTVKLTAASAAVSRTLSAANPRCSGPGHASEPCFCGTCDNPVASICGSNADCGPRCAGGGNQAAPCTSASECPGGACRGGTTCQGRRCVGGVNVGAPCTTASECPSGSCTRAGVTTAPNQCDDGTCTATGDEGTCEAGPTEFFCVPDGVAYCTTDADCGYAGMKSCRGGTNDNAACSAASECPGGVACQGVCEGGANDGAACANGSACPGGTCPSGETATGCCTDLCTGMYQRACYPDNGVTGNGVTVTGVADPGTDADPTLASLYCVPPTTLSSGTNALTGLPGLGRLTMPVHVRYRP